MVEQSSSPRFALGNVCKPLSCQKIGAQVSLGISHVYRRYRLTIQKLQHKSSP
jgi:hypothetical protein